MRLTLALAVAFATAILVGCNQGQAKSGTTGGTASGAPSGAVVKPSQSDIPDSLKHAAFDYYGLNNPKQVEMELTVNGGERVMTGTQSVVLETLEDGVAVFKIDRTGQLAQLGSMEISVEDDGIYAKSASIGQISRALELPSDLTVGKAWDSELKMEGDGRELSQKSSMKAVRAETVKTKAGEFKDALRIEGNGSGTFNGQQVKIQMTGWYVKGEGAVRLETVITKADGAKDTQVIERSK